MIAIAVHGGAGDRIREQVTSQQESEYRESIDASMQAGYAILRAGGKSVDAVEHVVRMMEDYPCYNAGVGAALNSRAEAELDAGIIEGAGLQVGAVAGVRTIRHPITAARYIMEHTSQVFMIAESAEHIASTAGLEMVDNNHFITKAVREKYDQDLRDRAEQAHQNEKVVLGTVGCVALDDKGHLCSGNSTGGIMHKPAGRVGDTPVNGAGMFAMDGIAAIACTGHGEYFVRVVAAHACVARMRYLTESLEQSMLNVLKEIGALGGRGGMIGVDAKGNVSMPFTTSSMVRAGIDGQGRKIVDLW